jgi:hypothetical protein
VSRRSAERGRPALWPHSSGSSATSMGPSSSSWAGPHRSRAPRAVTSQAVAETGPSTGAVIGI